MTPAISVIVPVHNGARYLAECLDSILAQSFTDFEVILVDDGSTDQSGKIGDRYAGRDPRVRVFHKKYGGVSSARNVGIREAQGEYIGFVDCDDRIGRHMYQTLYSLCQKTGSDIAVCRLGREVDGRLINGGAETFVKEMDNQEAMRELFKGQLYRFSLCNKLFHRRCFERIQFPEGRIHEDLATTYKLFARANKVVFTNMIGYIYVKRENSILTSDYRAGRLDSFTAWDDILPFMSARYPQLMAEVTSCFVFWCIDHAFYILDQVKNKAERKGYLDCVQRCLRKHDKTIQEAGALTATHKAAIILLKHNFHLFMLVNLLKNKVKGRKR
ncbi:glycosyltransferase family 2 protein [Camelliibacillus cellulosilyticus]|uniref:Glycosyltransferase family 2 protein n=1 Tax=Camelliibacillus cellulosilyticus TaxID=2174486 RepID=A0ABV9GS43_9BACL